MPDGWADGARAIHVIEHFYAWEALDLVTEWVRVLKPGAQLAIECPCLDKIFALGMVPQVPPNYTMWALYGNPKYKEPGMCHKWGYSQMSLIRLMTMCGLENVKPGIPQFHVPVRDMRVTGCKPAGMIVAP